MVTSKPELDNFRVSFRPWLRVVFPICVIFKVHVHVYAYTREYLFMCVSDLNFYILAPNAKSLNQQFYWHCYHP